MASFFVDAMSADAEMMALLKPQFEHRDYLSDNSFKGVVRGVENHQAIMQGVLDDLASLLPDWQLVGLDFSPITGPKGNIEFLLHYGRGSHAQTKMPISDLKAAIQSVITKSYESHPPK